MNSAYTEDVEGMSDYVFEMYRELPADYSYSDVDELVWSAVTNSEPFREIEKAGYDQHVRDDKVENLEIGVSERFNALVEQQYSDLHTTTDRTGDLTVTAVNLTEDERPEVLDTVKQHVEFDRMPSDLRIGWVLVDEDGIDVKLIPDTAERFALD